MPPAPGRDARRGQAAGKGHEAKSIRSAAYSPDGANLYVEMTIVPTLEADPVVNGTRRVAFISSDDDGAKKEVDSLLTAFGYSVIDIGNLRDGGLIQQAGGPLAGRNLFEEGERHK